MKKWYVDYIGIPWGREHVSGARSYDCWGLVNHCLNMYYSVDMPEFDGITSDDVALIDCEVNKAILSDEWVRCEEPVDGCVVLMSRRRVIHHIGIFVDGGILHSRKGAGACFERESALSKIGFNKIEYYKNVSNT